MRPARPRRRISPRRSAPVPHRPSRRRRAGHAGSRGDPRRRARRRRAPRRAERGRSRARSRARSRLPAGRGCGRACARDRPGRPASPARLRPPSPAERSRGARGARGPRTRARTRRVATSAYLHLIRRERGGRYAPVMATDTHNALAAQLAKDAAERFLRYVRIDTQSEEDSESYPSTAKQLDPLRLLVGELMELGLADASLDENGYVTSTLPATVSHETRTIAFFAHVDTAREAPLATRAQRRSRGEGGA